MVAGFSSLSSFTGNAPVSYAASSKGSLTMEYVPSGMSKEQYRKLKEQERKKTQGKNLGTVGITTFKSRTFSDWQASGGKNLFPVDPRKVNNPKEIPYMQRPGGAPDDSDLGSNGGVFPKFGLGKKSPKPEPVPQKKTTNWWTL
ncbi:hypothetical protein ACA910_017757 [Epithemia clementina (nom. ined.)]